MPRRASRSTACCLQLVLLSDAFIGVMGVAGCGSSTHGDSPQPKSTDLPVIKAVVARIEPVNWPAVVRTQGSFIADEVTIVGAKVAGRINEVNFDLGDAVKARDIVGSLDQEDFKLQVVLAEAQLLQSRAALGLAPDDPLESLDPENAPPVREAKAMWDETRARGARVRQLLLNTRNTVTQEEYDQAVAAEGAAAARHAAAINGVREKIALINVRASELKVAQQRLYDTVIRAPFDGLVQERHVAQGSFVQLGDPIITLVRTSVLRFRGTMPERHAHRLKLGQEVRLSIEGVPEPRVARITRISPAVEEMSRSLAFEALVNNADGSLRTGLFAQGEVIVDPQAQALVVPRSAVVQFAGTEKVWKVVSGDAKETLVQTARRTDQTVEITAGLAAGDEVLVNAGEGRVAKVVPIYQESPAADEVQTSESIPAGEEANAAATLRETTVSTHAVDR
jgi:RND family efflux transporter MFP subunit